MCSIFGVLEVRQDLTTVRQMALRQSRLLRHRGPDWSGIYSADHAVLAHERLSIVDVNTGAQPILSESGRQALAVNGEIYNHQDIRDRFEDRYAFRTQSDCEVILPLYLEHGPDFLEELCGMYAFCLYDEEQDRWMMARDPIGIIPLYYGHDANGQLFVASEMKALMDVCNQVHEFPPGHYWVSGQDEPQRWYRRDWENFSAVENAVTDRAALREALERAVVSHLMTDVPYGVLLSGGLDSSITAALAAKHAAMRVEDHEETPAWWPRLHSFAIGLEGSPDLEAAQRAADHIGTVHHGFTFTIQEGLDALEEVIYHLEPYDVTTIRAATPMFLMARKIRAMGIKMVLSGEGADEIFGGYLYFHKAPTAQASGKSDMGLLQFGDVLRLLVGLNFQSMGFLQVVGHVVTSSPSWQPRSALTAGSIFGTWPFYSRFSAACQSSGGRLTSDHQGQQAAGGDTGGHQQRFQQPLDECFDLHRPGLLSLCRLPAVNRRSRC